MAHAFNEAMFKGFNDSTHCVDEFDHEFTAKAYENGRMLAIWIKTVLQIDTNHITVDNINQEYKKYKKDL